MPHAPEPNYSRRTVLKTVLIGASVPAIGFTWVTYAVPSLGALALRDLSTAAIGRRLGRSVKALVSSDHPQAAKVNTGLARLSEAGFTDLKWAEVHQISTWLAFVAARPEWPDCCACFVNLENSRIGPAMLEGPSLNALAAFSKELHAADPQHAAETVARLLPVAERCDPQSYEESSRTMYPATAGPVVVSYDRLPGSQVGHVQLSVPAQRNSSRPTMNSQVSRVDFKRPTGLDGLARWSEWQLGTAEMEANNAAEWIEKKTA